MTKRSGEPGEAIETEIQGLNFVGAALFRNMSCSGKQSAIDINYEYHGELTPLDGEAPTIPLNNIEWAGSTELLVSFTIPNTYTNLVNDVLYNLEIIDPNGKKIVGARVFRVTEKPDTDTDSDIDTGTDEDSDSGDDPDTDTNTGPDCETAQQYNPDLVCCPKKNPTCADLKDPEKGCCTWDLLRALRCDQDTDSIIDTDTESTIDTDTSTYKGGLDTDTGFLEDCEQKGKGGICTYVSGVDSRHMCRDEICENRKKIETFPNGLELSWRDFASTFYPSEDTDSDCGTLARDIWIEVAVPIMTTILVYERFGNENILIQSVQDCLSTYCLDSAFSPNSLELINRNDGELTRIIVVSEIKLNTDPSYKAYIMFEAKE